MFKTIEWTDEGVRMIDQRRLPGEEVYLNCKTSQEVADAIRNMVIRGAPAIGVAAAMGIALGVRDALAKNLEEMRAAFDRIAQTIAQTRPTAVNLFWAIKRMREAFEECVARGSVVLGPAGKSAQPTAGSELLSRIRERLIEEAQQILAEDVAINRAMGRHGAALLADGSTVLTHCNAGALATGGYGTALGVIRAAVEQGKRVAVFADETRPFLQGARLTAWELIKDNIPVTLITDNMAGYFMHQRKIQAVVVGADRIAANGDVANKIGTYSVAVLARENGIPFYVAAPLSTLDLETPSGDKIPIEERSPEEVTRWAGVQTAPAHVEARHPAFDITPHPYVTAIITERGVARPPYYKSLPALLRE